jgi:hypothetical protein
MTALAFVFTGALAVGLLAFAAWCVYVFTTKELAPQGDWTTWLVFQVGRGVIWTAALLVAGGILGGAAAVMWRSVG